MIRKDVFWSWYTLHQPLKFGLTIMKNLAEALHFIHAKDIIHRDLKSDNVVLNRPKQFLSYCQSFNYVN